MILMIILVIARTLRLVTTVIWLRDELATRFDRPSEHITRLCENPIHCSALLDLIGYLFIHPKFFNADHFDLAKKAVVKLIPYL
jgi:hypothetical protein